MAPTVKATTHIPVILTLHKYLDTNRIKMTSTRLSLESTQVPLADQSSILNATDVTGLTSDTRAQRIINDIGLNELTYPISTDTKRASCTKHDADVVVENSVILRNDAKPSLSSASADDMNTSTNGHSAMSVMYRPAPTTRVAPHTIDSADDTRAPARDDQATRAKYMETRAHPEHAHHKIIPEASFRMKATQIITASDFQWQIRIARWTLETLPSFGDTAFSKILNLDMQDDALFGAIRMIMFPLLRQENEPSFMRHTLKRLLEIMDLTHFSTIWMETKDQARMFLYRSKSEMIHLKSPSSNFPPFLEPMKDFGQEEEKDANKGTVDQDSELKSQTRERSVRMEDMEEIQPIHGRTAPDAFADTGPVMHKELDEMMQTLIHPTRPFPESRADETTSFRRMFQKPDTASRPKREDSSFDPKREHKEDHSAKEDVRFRNIRDERTLSTSFEGKGSERNIPSIAPSVCTPVRYPDREYFKDVLSIPELRNMMDKVPAFRGEPVKFFVWLTKLHHLVTTMNVPDGVALI